MALEQNSVITDKDLERETGFRSLHDSLSKTNKTLVVQTYLFIYYSNYLN